MICIYTCYFDPLTRPVSMFEHANHLPADVMDRAGRFRKSDDQQCYLLGRLLLRLALSELKLSYTIGQIKLTDHGRPYFTGDIDFNISHSGTFVVCAISTAGRIGIDVECVKPIDRSDFKSCFLPSEWEVINLAADDKIFYTYWTMKEAAIKADGRGLSLPLSDVCIKGHREVHIEQSCWNILSIDTDHPEYVCHLACTAGSPEVVVKSIPAEALAVSVR